MELKDYIAIAILFITLFWISTLPIYKDKMPYGEGDAAFHFSDGEIGYSYDHLSWNYPDWWSWYSSINKYGYNYPQHPPTKATSYAIVSIVGGDRIIAAYIFIPLISFLSVFSVFFVLKKLFNSEVAFLASFMLIFSKRDILVSLWGQNPSLFSISFVSITLYALYSYLLSFFENKERPVYLYIFILLFSSQYLIHIQGLVPSFFGSVLMILFFSIKYKAFPITLKNLKNVSMGLMLLLILTLPFIRIYTGTNETPQKIRLVKLDRLLYWFNPEKEHGSYGAPPIYLDYRALYGWLLISLVVIGSIYSIIQAFLKKKNNFILISCWLIGFYLSIHLEVFGIAPDSYRSARMLTGEAALFFSLASIGVFLFINMISSFLRNYAKYIKYSFLLIIVIFVSLTFGREAYSMYDSAYQAPLRITPYQYSIAEWMDRNLPKNASLHVVGSLTYPTFRFMNRLSHRSMITAEDYDSSIMEGRVLDYLLIDYSGVAMLANYYPQQRIFMEKMKKWEKSIQPNVSIVYSGEYHSIYKINSPYLNNSGGIPRYLI